MMLFIWFVCVWICLSASASLSKNEFESSLLRNYAVDTASVSASRLQFKSLLRNDVADDLKANMSFRISGPNGNCAQLEGGSGDFETKIVLSPCGSTFDFIWILESNGIIRTQNGRSWLNATSDIKPGASIYLSSGLVAWELGNDGQIVHKESGLVLTAVTGNNGTQLTLDTNVASSFQTWRTDNNTNPNLVSITGLSNGLCIQATNNTKVLVTQCNTMTNHEQRFLIYPDGTIRPELNTNGCLTYDNLINNTIIVLTCSLAPSSQRWLYTTNATILNPRSNLVMELLKEEIIVSSPAADNLNQKWIFMPI